jgi:hypothetical protein
MAVEVIPGGTRTRNLKSALWGLNPLGHSRRDSNPQSQECTVGFEPTRSFPAGLEPAISRVHSVGFEPTPYPLGHGRHTCFCGESGFRSRCLVVANDALFQESIRARTHDASD